MIIGTNKIKEGDFVMKQNSIELSFKNNGWGYLIFQRKNRFKLELSISYLEDIPLIWLDSILFNLKYNLPFVLKGDSEGSKFSIIESDVGLAIIIEDTGGYNLDCFGVIYLPDILKKELIEAVISGMENCLSEIVDWNPRDLSDEERIKRKDLLITQLSECKRYFKF